MNSSSNFIEVFITNEILKENSKVCYKHNNFPVRSEFPLSISHLISCSHVLFLSPCFRGTLHFLLVDLPFGFSTQFRLAMKIKHHSGWRPLDCQNDYITVNIPSLKQIKICLIYQWISFTEIKKSLAKF